MNGNGVLSSTELMTGIAIFSRPLLISGLITSEEVEEAANILLDTRSGHFDSHNANRGAVLQEKHSQFFPKVCTRRVSTASKFLVIQWVQYFFRHLSIPQGISRRKLGVVVGVMVGLATAEVAVVVVVLVVIDKVVSVEWMGTMAAVAVVGTETETETGTDAVAVRVVSEVWLGWFVAVFIRVVSATGPDTGPDTGAGPDTSPDTGTGVESVRTS